MKFYNRNSERAERACLYAQSGSTTCMSPERRRSLYHAMGVASIVKTGEKNFVELLFRGQGRSDRGRRDFDILDGSISLKLADHFLASFVCIQHLTEEGPEGILCGEKSSATYGPFLLRLQECAWDKLIDYEIVMPQPFALAVWLWSAPSHAKH